MKNFVEKFNDKNELKKMLFDWLDTIVISVIAVIFITTVMFRTATIIGDSMQNTFFAGERVVISKLFYEPTCGDVVVISRNVENRTELNSYQEPIIKRIIATGGMYVDIDFDNGEVYTGYSQSNMKRLDEPYIKVPTKKRGEVKFPLYVPKGKVFVLGDNRGDSLDSRYTAIGLIDEKDILGKVIFRIFPFDRIGGVYNYE